MQFGPDGTLYISTGDDTIHYESSGFNPIDERLKDDGPTNNFDAAHGGDARRTSGNTNDLRGKILRIRPDETSPEGYTIPTGNLFGSGGSYPDADPLKARREIFTMGHRNPFRITVDQETGWIYNGEVGPDANADSPTRGPRGYDEFNPIRQAGNMGWPFCIADNTAYGDHNFFTGVTGPKFDCAGGPDIDTDDSAGYLSGLAKVPPAQPAMVYYPYGTSPDFPPAQFPGCATAPAAPPTPARSTTRPTPTRLRRRSSPPTTRTPSSSWTGRVTGSPPCASTSRAT